MKDEPARDEGYAIVPRWIMKDQRFTVHMVMVYLALQSFSGVTGSVIPSVATLAKRARLAVSTTRTTLRALEEIGVIVTEARYDQHGDRTSNNYILLTHDPKAPPESGVPPHRAAVYPPPEPGAKGTPSKKPDISYEISASEGLIEPPVPGPDPFDEFWALYPRKEGKGDARKAWLSVTKITSPGDIITGLRRLLPSYAARDPLYVKTPAPWLRGERWNDDPDPAPSSTSRGGTKPQRPPIDPQREWEYR